MSRTLVVVTCNRDQWSFEMLCRSMDKFLEPCKVIFIYNHSSEEHNKWRKFYKRVCQPHLSKFDVQVLNKDNFWSVEDECHLQTLQLEGWVDQQVIKLGVAEFVETEDYVVLDAKNFFFKPTCITDIQQIKPEPTDWCEPILKNWIITCCETVGYPIPSSAIKLTQNITPYVINTQNALMLLKYFGGTRFLFKWFSIEARKERHSPAEFFLYEIFTKLYGIPDEGTTTQNCIAFWEHMHTRQRWRLKDYLNFIDHIDTMYDVNVASFHKGMVPYWTRGDVITILKKLNCADIMPAGEMPFVGEKSYSNKINSM